MKFKSRLTALATALSPVLIRGLRAAYIPISPLPARPLRSFIAAALILHFTLYTLPSPAAEPCHWVRKPNHPEPFLFDTYHGETIDFRCTFVGFSSLPFAGSGDSSPRLYYQTNGMAAAWWYIPATVSTTVVTNCPQQTANYQLSTTNYQLSATFPPSADPGSERLTVFFGAPSNAYAAAQVRFRNSPGATPNDLDPPSVLDWQSSLAAATNSVYAAMMAEVASSTNALLKSLAPTIASATNDLHKSLAPTITNAYDKAMNAYAIATNALTRQEAAAGLTEWAYSGLTAGATEIADPRWNSSYLQWEFGFTYDGDLYSSNASGSETDTDLEFVCDNTTDPRQPQITVTATRVRLPTWSDITNITTQLEGKASTNDVQLTPVYGGNGERFSEWVVVPDRDGLLSVMWLDDDDSGKGTGWFLWDTEAENYVSFEAKGNAQSTSLSWTTSSEADYIATATRTENPLLGFTLGTQTNSVLAATNALLSSSITNGLVGVSSLTNDVCNIVTNEVPAGWSDWVVTSTVSVSYVGFDYVGEDYYGDPAWEIEFKAYDRDYLGLADGDENATYLECTGGPMDGSGSPPVHIIATRIYTPNRNALGLARLTDITNTVTKAYVEDLGIESGIQFEEDPHWEAAKGGYATTGTVAQVSEAVGTLWSYVYGDSVWIAVTNYMRTVGGVSPSFQLWEVRNGVTNLVYWSKEEITNVTHDLIHDCKTNLEATVRNAVAEMPDKAWSKYQSATGNEAPDGVTIVSTPTIQLTGGGEWYRYVDVARNSVWFLKSNGLHTFGGDTNGYFRILDDEGNATFEVRKTDSYLVDAVASSVHFDENGNFCVSFESNIEPVIYTTASLENPNFLPQGDDPNVTVTWTQSGGTYTATLEQTVKGPSLFAYAKVEVQGETVIRNSVPTDMQGGIVVNGVKYNVGTATINGNTVLTLTPRN